MPLKHLRPPDIYTAVWNYRNTCEMEPRDIVVTSCGEVSAPEFAHLAHKTGPYKELKQEEHGEKWRSPISLGTLVSMAQTHPNYERAGRIPILFYDLDSGKLIFPFSDQAEPRTVIDRFVIPYLGLQSQATGEYFHNALLRRFNDRKRAKQKVKQKLYKSLAHKRGQNQGTVTEEEMKEEDISRLTEINVRLSQTHPKLFGTKGLSIDTAFLFPRVKVDNRQELLDLVADHLR